VTLPLPTRKQLQLICFAAICLNTLLYVLVKSVEFQIGGAESGNDSEYYHSYAIGLHNTAVNIWPIFLRFLNNNGLYDRGFTSLLLFFLYIVFAVTFPRLAFIRLCKVSSTNRRIEALRWFFTILLLSYPTLFLFSLDLYRDVLMLSLVAVAFAFGFQILSPGKLLPKLPLYFCFVSVCFLLFSFRSYLGLSSLLALFFYWKPSRNRIYAICFFYILSLVVFKATGLLEPMTQYRGAEGFQQGGSSFGIGLQDTSALALPFLVVLNIFYQFFGLYVTSPQAFAVFVIESIPFALAIRYVYVSRAFMDRPCLYLFYFIIIYSSFAAIGNDNLGTALRLRIFTYAATGLLALRLAALRLNFRASRNILT